MGASIQKSLVIDFPNIDPVAFFIGDVAVYWYGINYVAASFLMFPYVKLLAYRKKVPLDQAAITFEEFSRWAFPVVLGGMVGARVLDFVFYNPSTLIYDPVAVFRVWEGGMSIHGGVIGAILLSFLYSRFRRKIFGKRLPFLLQVDIVAAYIPFFLFTGRLTNFINGELYGKPTQVPWAVVFPAGGDILRHPTQIYEAITEGLIILVITNFLVWRRNILFTRHGLCAALALSMYSVFRFIIEWFKESPVALYGLTTGQLLSLIWFAAGLTLLCFVRLKKSY